MPTEYHCLINNTNLIRKRNMNHSAYELVCRKHNGLKFYMMQRMEKPVLINAIYKVFRTGDTFSDKLTIYPVKPITLLIEDILNILPYCQGFRNVHRTWQTSSV